MKSFKKFVEECKAIDEAADIDRVPSFSDSDFNSVILPHPMNNRDQSYVKNQAIQLVNNVKKNTVPEILRKIKSGEIKDESDIKSVLNYHRGFNFDDKLWKDDNYGTKGLDKIYKYYDSVLDYLKTELKKKNGEQ